MAIKADLAIGIAIFARSFVSCEAGMIPLEAAIGLERIGAQCEHSIDAQEEPLLLWRRNLRGLSQDPARSRAQIKPLPRALYKTFPRGA